LLFGHATHLLPLVGLTEVEHFGSPISRAGLRTEGIGVIGGTGRTFEFPTDAPDGPYDLSALSQTKPASCTSCLARAMSQLRHLLSGQRRTDAVAIIEPPARLAGSMPSQNLFLDLAQLSAKGRETGTGYRRNSLIGRTPRRPTGATIPNSARWARIAFESLNTVARG
jgi:hypothetical protein